MSVNAKKLKTGMALVASSVAILALPAGAGAACTPSNGGISAGTCGSTAGPVGKAKLLADGTAVAPANAPMVIRDVIDAANTIERKPYIYGGGHGKWWDKGYDCSGAVSYALHGGDLLTTPLDSSSFMKWDKGGLGKWITVFSNPGHAYAVIAGLRWDTSMTPGNGPGWSAEMRSRSGYVARHPTGW